MAEENTSLVTGLTSEDHITIHTAIKELCVEGDYDHAAVIDALLALGIGEGVGYSFTPVFVMVEVPKKIQEIKDLLDSKGAH